MAFRKITFTLLISSALAFSGWAGSVDYWLDQKDKKKEEKKIERPVEKDKKKNEDQGGDRGGGKKDDGGKKGKKP